MEKLGDILRDLYPHGITQESLDTPRPTGMISLVFMERSSRFVNLAADADSSTPEETGG